MDLDKLKMPDYSKLPIKKYIILMWEGDTLSYFRSIMKYKIKFDQFLIKEKGKEYRIILFPFIENMIVMEANHDSLYIDGSEKVFEYILYIYVILANNKDVIIYVPCKQQNFMSDQYEYSRNLIIYRRELQFRRSLWFKIKKKLNKNTKINKYILSYDQKKLLDYYEKGLWYNFNPANIRNQMISLPGYLLDKICREYKEEVIEDNLFCIISRESCYIDHYMIVEHLNEYYKSNEDMAHAYVGAVMSDDFIKKLKEKIYD